MRIADMRDKSYLEYILGPKYNALEIMITGGTGSLGTALIDEIIRQKNKGAVDVNGIRIYSRDELKQLNLKNKLQGKTDIPIAFILGDIRDATRINEAMRGCNLCFHTAALKQVPTAERNPIEYIKTNINGTENVVRACTTNLVPKAVLISTDKACEPINLYGASKTVAEKLWLNSSIYNGERTKFVAVRYGNVIGSRGSLVDILRNNVGEIPITDPEMTRFWIKLKDVSGFVFDVAKRQVESGRIYIPSMMSCSLENFVMAITGTDKSKWKIIGPRNGEKKDELLINQEEIDRTEETSIDGKSAYVVHPYGGRDNVLGKRKKMVLSSNNNPMFVDDLEQIKKYCL